MIEFLRQFYIQASTVGKKLGAKQKITILVVTVFSIIMIVYLMVWTGERQWSVLQSNLQPEDAQSIIEFLESEGISYKLETDGTAILVPMGTEPKLRMQVSAKGLVTGGVVGYELFDKPNIGMTDFIQKINNKRALEGELSRTIRSMEMIESARVSIVIPVASLFVTDQKPTTASIFLSLMPGQDLSIEQINSIAQLVANSVEGLKPPQVAIIDSYGNHLSKSINKNPLLAMRSDQFKIQRQYEIELKSRLDVMLAEALGPSNAIVDVSVELDFTQANTTSTTYGEPPVIRSQETEESASAVKDSIGRSGTSERITTNNEVNQEIRNTIEEFGTIKRITASVMVNGRYTEENGVQTYNDRDDAELGRIRESVISAIGMDLEGRGDVISIVPFQFDISILTDQQEKLKAQEREELYRTLAKWGAILISVLGCLLILRSIFRSLDLLLPKPKPKPAIDIEAEAIEEEISAESQRRAQMLEQVSKFTREKPQNVASLLSTWLIEEKA